MVQWIPDNGSILYLFNGVLVILFYSSFQYLKQSWQYSRFTHYLSLNLRKSASNQGFVHVFSWIAQCFSPPGIFHRQKIHLNGVSFIHLLMSQGHGKTGWSWFLSALCPFSVAELSLKGEGILVVVDNPNQNSRRNPDNPNRNSQSFEVVPLPAPAHVRLAVGGERDLVGRQQAGWFSP